MKIPLFLFFYILCFYQLQSQSTKSFDFELLGAIVLESNQSISYKVKFNVNQNNFLEGYSYTDIGGENETKSYVKGYYDSKTQKIKFKESEILYTKSKFLPEEFCFVYFSGRFKSYSKKKTLNGNFTGIYDDRDTCALGSINLVSTKFVKKKLQKVYKKIKNIRRVDSTVKSKIKPENFLKKFSETKINSGEKVSVFVYSSKIKVDIWDYGIEDGDIITILQNEKPILENFKVTKRVKRIFLDLKEKDNLLKIITVNSGKLKTNTTKLKIYDFRREYEVIANLDQGKAAEINVVKLTVKKKN